MTSRTTKTVGLVAAGAFGLLPVGLGLASTAQAAPAEGGDVGTMSCSHRHSDKDKSGYGYVTADWLRYRSGPHTTCTAYGQEKDGTKIYYHCYTTTKNDGTWTYGLVSGTDRKGWFKDEYLSNWGSTEPC